MVLLPVSDESIESNGPQTTDADRESQFSPPAWSPKLELASMRTEIARLQHAPSHGFPFRCFNFGTPLVPSIRDPEK